MTRFYPCGYGAGSQPASVSIEGVGWRQDSRNMTQQPRSGKVEGTRHETPSKSRRLRIQITQDGIYIHHGSAFLRAIWTAWPTAALT